MPAVSTATFIQDSVINLRDLLVGADGVTDPVTSGRPANSRFVVTSYPHRDVFYPIITVKVLGPSETRRLGMRSEGFWTKVDFEVRIWAKDVKQCDDLTQQAFDALRDEQLTASTGTVALSMFGLTVTSTIEVNEDGVGGIKSKILNGFYYLTLS